MNEAIRNAPWVRIFAMVTGFLVLFLGVLVFRGGGEREAMREWTALAAAFRDQSTPPTALGPIVEAFEKTDWKALLDTREALRAASRAQGGEAQGAVVAELIERHQPAIAALSRSAALRECRFPPTDSLGILAPKPDFASLEALGLLCAANAARLAAAGRHDEAVQRLVELALLGGRFARPREEATLVGHVASAALIELAAQAMIDVAASGGASPVALGKAARQLLGVESVREPMVEGLRAEISLFSDEIAGAEGSASRLARVIAFYRVNSSPAEAAALAEELLPTVAGAQREIARLWDPLFEALGRPCNARSLPTEEELRQATTSALALIHLPDPRRYSHRECHAVARLRLAAAACLLAAGEAEHAAGIEDPFSGRPVEIFVDLGGNARLWMRGPDGDDDGGLRVHSPMDGAVGDGDIVATLPPPRSTPER